MQWRLIIKNKKILVIGAGSYQTDAIQRAKDLGYIVLASDGCPNAPGLAIATEGRVIDVTDVAANLAWAKEAKIDGVISYASDIALATVLAIREALDLPGLNKGPLEVSLDKSQQRVLFAEKGLSQPKFSVVTCADELDDAAQKLGFPLVLKPVDNSGSRGISMVVDYQELRVAFEGAYEHSQKGQVILEEFVKGTELTVEGISIDGKHHILAISDKYKPEGAYRVATQLAYPAAISEKTRQEVIELMTQAYNAAEVDNTPTHSEVIITLEGRPKIIEVGCRGGGFYVFTRVVQAVSNYDIVGNWTRLCLGDPLEPIVRENKGAVLRFFVAHPGKLLTISGFEEAMTLPGVSGGLFVKPGEIVPELKTDGSRTGWIIVTGETREACITVADRAFELVRFESEVASSD